MMEKIFSHSGWLKLLSVVLAVMLWYNVMQGNTEEGQRTFDVTLQVIRPNNPNLIALEQDALPETVQIRVDGKKLYVQPLKAENFKAWLDLNDVPETETGKPIPLQIHWDAVGVRKDQFQTTVTPKSIAITLVEQKSASVEVSLQTSRGIVTWKGSDYLYTATPDAKSVRLFGRGDYLDQVRWALVNVEGPDLTPDAKSVTRTAQPMDKDFKPVKLPGPPVTVSLAWEKLPPGKSFTVHPVTIGTLPQGLTVSSVDVEPATVLVRAATLNGKLPDQAVVDTTPIDVTGKTKSFTAQVHLVAPAGTVVPTDPVSVKVNIDEATVEKVFKGIPLTKHGTPNGGDVTLAVTDVQVRVSGRFSVVNKLTPADLTAFVDLDSLTPGRHTLPVKVNWPDGVLDVRTDPNTVDINVATP